jgi:hypothetical protein
MPFAIWSPGNRTAAKTKIGAPRIAIWPAASLWAERDDLFGRSLAWVGRGGVGEGGVGEGEVDEGGVDEGGISEGGRLDVCHDGRLRHRFDEERSGRLRRSAAICPGGDSDGGSLLDLVNRHCSRSQEAEHNTDSTWDAAIAVLPAPDAPRADAEQPGNAVLCDAERVECFAEFDRGQVTCFCVKGHTAP